MKKRGAIDMLINDPIDGSKNKKKFFTKRIIVYGAMFVISAIINLICIFWAFESQRNAGLAAIGAIYELSIYLVLAVLTIIINSIFLSVYENKIQGVKYNSKILQRYIIFLIAVLVIIIFIPAVINNR